MAVGSTHTTASKRTPRAAGTRARSTGGDSWPQVDFLRLEHWRTFNIADDGKGGFDVCAELLTALDTCPDCGARYPEFKHNGTKPQSVRDVPHGDKPVKINFRRRRYLCLRCRKTSQQPLPGVARGRKITERLVELIERESFERSTTFVTAARRLGVSDRTVRNVFTERALRLESSARIETPTRLGVDGVYIGGKERCAVTDLDTGRLVELLPECTYEAVLKFLILLPDRERVAVAATDMCPYLARALRRGLPGATRVIDTFHVQWLANKELNAILRRSRVKVLNKTGRRAANAQEGAKKVARTRFLLNRRRGRLDKREVEELLKWRKEVPLLDTAYKLKEGFLNVWLARDRAHAEAMYDRWERRAEKLLPKAFRKVRTSMRRLRSEIFNYFDTDRATNACTEARNNVVKTLQRAGRGYNFHVLRAKLLYGSQVTGQGIVARRPRKPKARRAARPANPRANGERLRIAYERRQEAEMPSRQAPGVEWLRRFGYLLDSETGREATPSFRARKGRDGRDEQRCLFPERRRATPRPVQREPSVQQQLFPAHKVI